MNVCRSTTKLIQPEEKDVFLYDAIGSSSIFILEAFVTILVWDKRRDFLLFLLLLMNAMWNKRYY